MITERSHERQDYDWNVESKRINRIYNVRIGFLLLLLIADLIAMYCATP